MSKEKGRTMPIATKRIQSIFKYLIFINFNQIAMQADDCYTHSLFHHIMTLSNCSICMQMSIDDESICDSERSDIYGCEKYLFDSSRWLLCCIVKLNGVQITPRSYTESRSMMMWLWLLNDSRNFVIPSLISVFDANIVSNIIINYLCKLITSSQVEPANKSSICNQFNRLARAHTFFSFCVLCWNIVNEWE